MYTLHPGESLGKGQYATIIFRVQNDRTKQQQDHQCVITGGDPPTRFHFTSDIDVVAGDPVFVTANAIVTDPTVFSSYWALAYINADVNTPVSNTVSVITWT